MKKSCMITHLMGILMITSIFTSCKNADVNKGERQVDSCMVTEGKKGLNRYQCWTKIIETTPATRGENGVQETEGCAGGSNGWWSPECGCGRHGPCETGAWWHSPCASADGCDWPPEASESHDAKVAVRRSRQHAGQNTDCFHNSVIP